ncbi:hypothetical protein IWX49DRAFT_412333 [Phyllosticta citricarpa]
MTGSPPPKNDNTTACSLPSASCRKNAKRTTAGIRCWSPTQLLIGRKVAYLWKSGRGSEFSTCYGRTWVIKRCKRLMKLSSKLLQSRITCSRITCLVAMMISTTFSQLLIHSERRFCMLRCTKSRSKPSQFRSIRFKVFSSPKSSASSQL